ncbi:VOC family protein [Puia sp. P3]|uniref:VOC family protein n=1 Tax=Puia sp. P3 TaxID=3423952 RepID=UPI003D66980D
MQLIIPMLAYENGVAAMEWLCEVFGFTEKLRWLDDGGRLSHGEIVMGDQVIMLASPTPGYQSPKRLRQEYAPAARWYQVPYIINGVLVYVADVEEHFRVASEGAR